MRPVIQILDGQSRYDIFREWQAALRDGFERAGVRASVVRVGQEGDSGANGHAVTLGFNLVRHWSVENLHRLHVAWTVDHPNFLGNFFLARQARTPVNPDCCALTSVDLKWARFARDAYGFPHVYFLPHASVQTVATAPDWSSRAYDAVFFGSLERPEDLVEALRKEAQEYAAPAWPFIQNLLDGFRYSDGAALDRCLWEAMRANRWPDEVARVFMNAFYPGLDSAHRYRSRLETVRSIRRHTVHLFGQGPWREAGLPPNVKVHGAVTYAEALGIMRQSRVLLNHTPTLTGGGHERIFDALLSGCFVVSTGSDFLSAEFPHGQGVAFYASGGADIDDLLDAVLADPTAADRVCAGQRRVLARHTMARRAGDLLRLIGQRWPDRFGEGSP